MIFSLASPSICVIDDEPADYESILNALNGLYLSCIHIRGTSIDQLPPQPFRGVRLVFTDLHLTGSSGKDAASHTANIFRKVISAETAPVVVVIWSKYANEQVVDSNLPPDDQETESQLFKRTLLEAENKYEGRLIFIEMAKPKSSDRPADWIGVLKNQIEQTLQGQEAIQALWAWENLVKEAGQSVSEELTSLARTHGMSVGDGLKRAMQLVVKAQSEGGVSTETAPKYLASVFAQLLMDKIEHSNVEAFFSCHGGWLCAQVADTKTPATFAPQMNAVLLTAATQNNSTPFLPGTIYKLAKREKFKELFGVECEKFMSELYKKDSPLRLSDWLEIAKPVVLEISTACDIDQGVRLNALLVAGLILPVAARVNAKTGGAFEVLPNFALRWPTNGFSAQDSFLMFCNRYKVTLPSAAMPPELQHWFRLRELPTAALRNWHASHSSRVGYVSL
ncbi:hypothetical protein RP726_13495 [Candidatus Methylospira mobilis]|uniref:hypothetical protein n=1 Tax=Candidatus Methylospira mobilis TaxID=1808979 RepID=UPI0028E3C295|nr:hypothetical protein [Candidatus Methylospira mobilis]WNV03464.1 hypothetical protein RP726_13495 [Candidatus Methylospira mobilis]